jgi:tyrosyl-tRNA synthetase
VLIIGDFTATIGDPSDKLEKRPMLTKEKIKENMKNYKKILGKIIDISKTEVVYNSTWLSKLGFLETAQLAESFSIQQMSKRRNFKERLDRDEDISLREFLYPIMQGYDSVMVKADVEIGGVDQLFNLLAGRKVQKHYDMPEQDIVATSMLEGLDGRKMSTSWGNVVNITDEPEEMFGKIMALNDNLIEKYFELCTDLGKDRLEEACQEAKKDPFSAKQNLASTIAELYHGKEKAEQAQTHWSKTFQKQEIPDTAKKIQVKIKMPLVDLLIKQGFVKSKTEFRRLVKERAIKFYGKLEEKKIIDPNSLIEEDGALKIGKKRFLKITVKKEN